MINNCTFFLYKLYNICCYTFAIYNYILLSSKVCGLSYLIYVQIITYIHIIDKTYLKKKLNIIAYHLIML